MAKPARLGISLDYMREQVVASRQRLAAKDAVVQSFERNLCATVELSGWGLAESMRAGLKQSLSKYFLLNWLTLNCFPILPLMISQSMFWEIPCRMIVKLALKAKMLLMQLVTPTSSNRG